MPKKKKIKESTKNILFIGDITGEVGRKSVAKVLPKIKEKYNILLTIANGEHLSERVGLDLSYVKEMMEVGIDFFTTGNHVWKKREFEEHIGKKDIPVIRPANFKGNLPGQGSRKIKTKFGNVLIINLLGAEGIDANVISPFVAIDQILKKEKGYSFSIVDFHAELTSEKVAMGQYLDGKVTAVLGTHTHVPTADARILPKGTAYVSDVGMVGPINSVLGVKSEIIIDRFKNGSVNKFELADGKGIFNAVIISIDLKTKKPIKIIRKDISV